MLVTPDFLSADSIAQAARAEATADEIVQLVNKTVAGSFREERLRGERAVVSLNEIKRRTRICWKWFRIMRFDCGYTVERTQDFLPIAVRREIDGVPWEPPAKEASWSPSGLAKQGS